MFIMILKAMILQVAEEAVRPRGKVRINIWSITILFYPLMLVFFAIVLFCRFCRVFQSVINIINLL